MEGYMAEENANKELIRILIVDDVEANRLILKDIILERLHVNKDTKEIKPDDPSQWEVGDILAGTFGYTISCPVFYKIIKRTAKQFTVARIPGKIISGHRNGQWKEIADEKATPEKETINARINKNGNVIVDGVYVRLWDGTPLQGDDMD